MPGSGATASVRRVDKSRDETTALINGSIRAKGCFPTLPRDSRRFADRLDRESLKVSGLSISYVDVPIN